MNDKVVNFDDGRQRQIFKRKEARVDAMRRAFRQAREEASTQKPADSASKTHKNKRSKKKK